MGHSVVYILAITAGAILSTGDAALAEVFRLKNGGQIEGEWLNRDESPRRKYVIRTRDGGQIALPAAEVHRPRTATPASKKYEQIRTRYANTVEKQWELAEWCRLNGLSHERKAHLNQVLELDPDHNPSRVALGFIRFGGKWTTRKQRYADLGYTFYEGQYRTKQEIAIVQLHKKTNDSRKGWIAKLKKWRGWLNSTRRKAEARDLILGIRDPYAVDAIAKMMEDERSREVKLLLIDTVANIPGQAAIFLLAKLSLEDKDSEIRVVARENIERLKSPFALDYFLRELKSKDNTRVNRAAKGLEALGESSAVRPLIEALVTKHQFKITTGKPGQIGGTFGGPGGGTFSSGGSTKIVTKDMANRRVLEALREQTGVDFDYNIDAWRRWYASKKKLDYVNARRDGQ